MPLPEPKYPVGDPIEEGQETYPVGEPIDERTFTQKAGDAFNSGMDFVVETGADAIRNTAMAPVKAFQAAANFMDESQKAAPYTGEFKGTAKDIGAKVVSGLIGMGKVAENKWNAMGENEKASFKLRMGTAAIAAAATGGSSIIVQAAVQGGAQLLAGEMAEEAGFEKNTPFFSREKMKRAGSDFIASNLIPQMLRVTGVGIKKTGEKIRGASVPAADKTRAALAEPGALTGQTTVGKNTPGEMQLKRDMQAGERTMGKVLLDEFPDTIETAGVFKSELQAAISRRKQAKMGAISSLDSALAKNAATTGIGKVSGFTRRDIGLGDLKAQLRKYKRTGINTEAIDAIEELQGTLNKAFFKPAPQGIKVPLPAEVNFTGMQNILDDVYAKLRKLKDYDDNSIAQKGTNPGGNPNREAIKIYSDVAKNIREAIPKKARALELRGKAPRGLADTLEQVNEEMHDLMPWMDGARRLEDAKYQTMKQTQPGSMMQPSGSAFSNNQSAKSMATDIATSPVTDPILERARANASLDFVPETIGTMQDIARMQQGRMSVPTTTGQGLSGRVIGPGLEALGGGMSSVAQSGVIPMALNTEVQSPLPVIGQTSSMNGSLDDFNSVTNDPLSMQVIEADPDLPPEILDGLAQVKNGTQYEKLQVFGKLKIAARDKGWFPPPPMQGIHSFTALPPDTQYRGQKVLGIITDPNEAGIYIGAVSNIPDVAKRTRLKAAFNDPHNRGYVLEIPSVLKPKPTPEPTPSAVEPESPQDDTTSSTANLGTENGASNMERVLHDN